MVGLPQDVAHMDTHISNIPVISWWTKPLIVLDVYRDQNKEIKSLFFTMK